MDPWLSRIDLHNAPRRRVIQPRCKAQRTGWLVQYPRMVVALAVANLLVVGIKRGPDLRQRGEVHRRAADRAQLAERGEGRVDREKVWRSQLQLGAENIPVAGPGGV